MDQEEDIILSNVTVATEPDEKSTDIDVKEEEYKMKLYDPFCRNPLHAGGYNALFQEMNAFINHYHPSVALFAKNILKGTNNFKNVFLHSKKLFSIKKS